MYACRLLIICLASVVASRRARPSLEWQGPLHKANSRVEHVFERPTSHRQNAVNNLNSIAVYLFCSSPIAFRDKVARLGSNACGHIHRSMGRRPSNRLASRFMKPKSTLGNILKIYGRDFGSTRRSGVYMRQKQSAENLNMYLPGKLLEGVDAEQVDRLTQNSSQLLSPIQQNSVNATSNVKLLPAAMVAAIVASLATIGIGSSDLDWRYFAAGGIGAAVSHGYTTPIDVVKTRMQTNPELYNGSVVNAVDHIRRDKGLAFLLQGLGPTAVGYGIEGALKFGIYEIAKPVFAGLTALTFVNYLAASVFAGIIASVVLCPAEDVRIRLVADPEFAPNSLMAFRKLVRDEGAFASFRGFNAMLAKQVPYTMAKQVSFDFFTSAIRGAASPQILATYPSVLTAVASLLAAILTCIASHPGDTLLSATFMRSEDKNASSVGKVFTNIIQERGVLGLFLGLKARLGHVISIITPQLVIYDIVKQLLGLPATGSS